MLKILLRKQLYELNSSFFYDRKKGRVRSKGTSILLIVLYALLMIVIMGGIFTMLSVMLCAPFVGMGLDWLYFDMMTLIALFLGVFGGVFNTYSSLYKARDNDLMLSLPIPTRYVLISRLTGVYLMGLMFSAVVMLPAVIVYFVVAHPAVEGVVGSLLLTVLVKVFAPMTEQWQTLLWIVTVSSITVANLFAIRQKDLKRFMAFSSISQAGYIMLAVIGGSAIGMTSLVFYVLVYMAANLAVFGVLSAVEQHSGGRVSLEDYNGFSRTNPRLALLMTLALFSLAGIPPFAGFFSKFFVFAAAFSGGFHLLVFIALVNTVVSLYYYLLIVKAMYIMPGDAPIAAFRSDRYTRVSLALCMAGVLLLGIVSAVYDGINAFAFGL